jgi:anthranilate synthase component 1
MSVRALTRSLGAGADPLRLYAALCGGRPDTVLIEKEGGPALLMERAALRIECHGLGVVVTALSANGETALAMLRARLANRIVAQGAGLIAFEFPPVAGDDAEQRLLAPTPLEVMRQLLRFESRSPEEPYALFAPFVLAFDYAANLEGLPQAAEDEAGFPDYVAWLAESLIVVAPNAPPRLVCAAFGDGDAAYFAAQERLADLLARCAALPPAPAPDRARAAPGIAVDLDDAAYGELVETMRGHIAAGEVYQIVPSRTFSAPCGDPLGAFAALRAKEASPYRYYVAGADFALLGASPETSVRVLREEGVRKVEIKPIAGTRPRGRTPDEDDRLEADLRLDGKELAEHMMLVDLARNDVARISVAGTRRVARLMTVERYARVMHLVTSVTGTLKLGLDAIDALHAGLNAGTLSGAPKIRATELLRVHEKSRRGPYGGAVGWFTGDGLLDSAIVIRSALVKAGVAYVRAGAGVVHDSVPAREAAETWAKAGALLSVLTGEAA